MKSAKEILAKSPKLKRQVKATAALTRYQEKFLDAVTELRANPDNTEAAFMARQLVQCTLPHKNPGNAAPTWRRKNGNLTLSIQQGLQLRDRRRYRLSIWRDSAPHAVLDNDGSSADERPPS
jgi:hypothetical protein